MKSPENFTPKDFDHIVAEPKKLKPDRSDHIAINLEPNEIEDVLSNIGPGEHVRKIRNDDEFVRATEQVVRESGAMELELRVLYNFLTDRPSDPHDVALVYNAAREKMLTLRDRYEDLTQVAPSDTSVRKYREGNEQAISDRFQRMLQMDIREVPPVQEAVTMSPEKYDSRIGEIMNEVIDTQDEFEDTLNKRPAEAEYQKFHEALDAATERINQLNVQAGGSVHSRERDTLEKLIDQLRARYPVRGPEKTAPDEYEKRVRDILTDVVTLENAFTFSLKKGLTKAKLQMLHDGLDAAQDRVQQLDEETKNTASSDMRRALMSQITRLRKEYPANMEQLTPDEVMFPKSPGNLSSVRDLHRRVRAAYISVQHTMTVDQRRDMRARIATLSSLARRSQEEQLAHMAPALLTAVSHATEHAPLLAHAAVGPKRPAVQPKKSAFSTLVAAFRLK